MAPLPRLPRYPIASEKGLLTTVGGSLIIPAKEKASSPLLYEYAPEIDLTDQEGNRCSLHATIALGRPIVLFFFPLAGSPHCTQESCMFRDALQLTPIFTALEVIVVGVSEDPPEILRKFVRKHSLTYRVLWDQKREAMNTYGVGHILGGLVNARCTYIIDSDGIIRAIMEGVWDAMGHLRFAEKWLIRLEHELSMRTVREIECHPGEVELAALPQGYSGRITRKMYGPHNSAGTGGVSGVPRYGAASLVTSPSIQRSPPSGRKPKSATPPAYVSGGADDGFVDVVEPRTVELPLPQKERNGATAGGGGGGLRHLISQLSSGDASPPPLVMQRAQRSSSSFSRSADSPMRLRGGVGAKGTGSDDTAWTPDEDGDDDGRSFASGPTTVSSKGRGSGSKGSRGTPKRTSHGSGKLGALFSGSKRASGKHPLPVPSTPFNVVHNPGLSGRDYHGKGAELLAAGQEAHLAQLRRSEQALRDAIVQGGVKGTEDVPIPLAHHFRSNSFAMASSSSVPSAAEKGSTEESDVGQRLGRKMSVPNLSTASDEVGRGWLTSAEASFDELLRSRDSILTSRTYDAEGLHSLSQPPRRPTSRPDRASQRRNSAGAGIARAEQATPTRTKDSRASPRSRQGSLADLRTSTRSRQGVVVDSRQDGATVDSVKSNVPRRGSAASAGKTSRGRRSRGPEDVPLDAGPDDYDEAVARSRDDEEHVVLHGDGRISITPKPPRTPRSASPSDYSTRASPHASLAVTNGIARGGERSGVDAARRTRTDSGRTTPLADPSTGHLARDSLGGSAEVQTAKRVVVSNSNAYRVSHSPSSSTSTAAARLVRSRSASVSGAVEEMPHGTATHAALNSQPPTAAWSGGDVSAQPDFANPRPLPRQAPPPLYSPPPPPPGQGDSLAVGLVGLSGSEVARRRHATSSRPPSVKRKMPRWDGHVELSDAISKVSISHSSSFGAMPAAALPCSPPGTQGAPSFSKPSTPSSRASSSYPDLAGDTSFPPQPLNKPWHQLTPSSGSSSTTRSALGSANSTPSGAALSWSSSAPTSSVASSTGQSQPQHQHQRPPAASPAMSSASWQDRPVSSGMPSQSGASHPPPRWSGGANSSPASHAAATWSAHSGEGYAEGQISHRRPSETSLRSVGTFGAAATAGADDDGDEDR